MTAPTAQPLAHPAHLQAIRAAHRDRIDAAALRDQFPDEPHGMPVALMSASCWLIAQGIPDDEPCAGEVQFCMPLSRVRRYCDGLSHAQLLAEIEAGRRAIYEGRHPIFVSLVSERKAA